MTSAALLTRPSGSPPPPTESAAFFSSLTEPLCCVVQLRTQPQGVIHQVILDPDKRHKSLIRLGEWPGDEILGWQHMHNIVIHAVLGRVERVSEREVKVTPLA